MSVCIFNYLWCVHESSTAIHFFVFQNWWQRFFLLVSQSYMFCTTPPKTNKRKKVYILKTKTSIVAKHGCWQFTSNSCNSTKTFFFSFHLSGPIQTTAVTTAPRNKNCNRFFFPLDLHRFFGRIIKHTIIIQCTEMKRNEVVWTMGERTQELHILIIIKRITGHWLLQTNETFVFSVSILWTLNRSSSCSSNWSNDEFFCVCVKFSKFSTKFPWLRRRRPILEKESFRFHAFMHFEPIKKILIAKICIWMEMLCLLFMWWRLNDPMSSVRSFGRSCHCNVLCFFWIFLFSVEQCHLFHINLGLFEIKWIS